MTSPPPTPPQQLVRVCAHRGCSNTHPENTLPAFEAAVALGCEQIELDVWLSADSTPVLLHDPSVDRTTNGEGFVWDLSDAQIFALDASNGQAGFAGVRIPTLGQALNVIPAAVEINVHVHPARDSSPAAPEDSEQLLQTVCCLLRRYQRLKSSFITGNETVMNTMRTLGCLDVRRCMGSRSSEVYESFSNEVNLYAIQPTNQTTDLALCEAIHARERLVWPFFANDVSEMRRLIACGVDGILTDHPERLIALLRHRPRI